MFPAVLSQFLEIGSPDLYEGPTSRYECPTLCSGLVVIIDMLFSTGGSVFTLSSSNLANSFSLTRVV